MIAIVDYGLGNVKAFANVYKALDVPCVIARTPADLENATRVILPGVGAFDQAMGRLHRSGMKQVLDVMALERKLPVLGVCVGMQMLMQTSEEGEAPGLGWIAGDVIRFEQRAGEPVLHVPHMGWNDARPARNDRLLQGFDAGGVFYFLHSYFIRCQYEADVLAVTHYGQDFTCALGRGNIYGVQFHPEKSHQHGVQLLKNFAEI